MQPNLEEWNEAAKEEVTTAEIDAAVEEFSRLRKQHDDLKDQLKALDRTLDVAESRLLQVLDKIGKNSWDAPGFGKIVKATRFQISVPKDLERKKELLQYFRDIGPDMYLQTVSIHSATLNSFYNAQKEENPQFTLPGVEAPTAVESLRFYRSKTT